MRRSFLPILGGLLAAAMPLAAQDFPPAPPVGEPKPFTVPAAETYSLPNGMNVTLVPYGVTPKAVVLLSVYAGNLNEGGDPWLADLTGDMLKEGAGGKDSAALATEAAAMGGDLNVAVGPLAATVNIGVLSEYAAGAVGLVSALARKPDFPASEFDRVKANAGRNLAVLYSQPGEVADYALARAYYGSHPFGASMPAPAKLASYTLDQVKVFHAANYGARRAHLYIAGQFDAAAVKQAIDAAFKDWAAGPERLALPSSPTPGPQLILVDRPGAPQSTLRLAFPTTPAGSATDIPLRVTNALLGGAFSSRITTNIREDKGYTYSPSSSFTYAPGEARWTFDADVTSANTGDSLKEVFGEIRRLQKEAPPADEAAGNRNYMAGTFVILNSNTAALVGSLFTRDALGLPADWLDKYVPAALAVAPQEMSRLTAASLPLDKMTLVVVGDLKSVEPQLMALPELKGLKAQRVTVP